MPWYPKDKNLLISSIISVLLHSALVGLLVSNWGPSACSKQSVLQVPASQSNIEVPKQVIKTKAVSQSEIDAIYEYKAELKRQAEEAVRKEAEEAARREAERKAAESARREAERKAAEEAARIEAERKAAEEAARKEAERKAAAEAARIEAERKAAEEAARIEAERKAAAEAARIEAERKAAAEAARREAERKAAEEAARIEAERKAAEEAARIEAERKAAEEAARRQHQKQLVLWTREYISMIRSDIEKQWTKPPKSINGGDCVVRLLQDESGNISQVNVIRCEGDHFYQRSVEDAVWKATPLPRPPSREVFDNTIEIIFRQEY